MEATPKCCDLCQDENSACVQVPHYKLMVCTACEDANRHGWQPKHEPLLRQQLAQQGLFIPDRTPQGRLPFHYLPPSDYAI